MSTTNTPGMTNGDSSAIRREAGLIPGWAYVLSACVFAGILFIFNRLMGPADFGHAGAWFVFFIPFLPATLLAFLVLMIGYVNQDAGRRGMSRTLWTLIVIFVPNAIGFIIYFLLRNPVLTKCPKCGVPVDARANYCPSCRYSFHPTCPQCKSAVQAGHTFCANCGVQLGG